MHAKNKIGWQKYEDVLTEQLDSPLLESLYERFMEAAQNEEDEFREEPQSGKYILPIDERFHDVVRNRQFSKDGSVLWQVTDPEA